VRANKIKRKLYLKQTTLDSCEEDAMVRASATLGHQRGPVDQLSDPRVVELGATVELATVTPRSRDYTRAQDDRLHGFLLAFPADAVSLDTAVSLHGPGNSAVPPPRTAGAHAAGATAEDAHGAAAEDAGGASEGGEAGDKAAPSPLPKFLVLPPGFVGQCACEIRVLPCLENEHTLLLEQRRQAPEVRMRISQPRGAGDEGTAPLPDAHLLV
jgi:hypothetical protein